MAGWWNVCAVIVEIHRGTIHGFVFAVPGLQATDCHLRHLRHFTGRAGGRQLIFQVDDEFIAWVEMQGRRLHAVVGRKAIERVAKVIDARFVGEVDL